MCMYEVHAVLLSPCLNSKCHSMQFILEKVIAKILRLRAAEVWIVLPVKTGILCSLLTAGTVSVFRPVSHH